MWGGAFSTFWKFLQPQLPQALSLQHGVQLADRGDRGLLGAAHLPRLRPGIPRRLRLRLPGDLQRGRGGPGQPAGALLRPGAAAPLHLLLARHVCHLPLGQARGQPRLFRRLSERQGAWRRTGWAWGEGGEGSGAELRPAGAPTARGAKAAVLVAAGFHLHGDNLHVSLHCSWEPRVSLCSGKRPRILFCSYPSYPCPGIGTQEGTPCCHCC